MQTNPIDTIAPAPSQDSAPVLATESSSVALTSETVATRPANAGNSIAGDSGDANVPIPTTTTLDVGRSNDHDDDGASSPSSSDTDDGDDDDDDDLSAKSSRRSVNATHATASHTQSSTTSATSPAALDVPTSSSCEAAATTGSSRKRPLELSAAAAAKQHQVRKRRYVNSSHTVDGVRKHVTVACARVDPGEFKCTFTLEHRRLEGTLNQQRANAKGGDIIERRHDVFMIHDPLGDDAPFPDYDRVYDNFLKRGIDICDHVSSELLPIRTASVPGTSPTAGAVPKKPTDASPDLDSTASS